MAISQHRLKEYLGGSVNLLVIDAIRINYKPSQIRRFINHYGENGEGVNFQGNTFKTQPYKVDKIRRNAKTNRSGGKVRISEADGYEFSRFLKEVGGIEGAKIYEMKVYERFLDDGVEPNPLAYIKRFDHEVDYVQQTDIEGEWIIHTIDPLSKDIKVPSLEFSSGEPNGTESSINIFPAVQRDIVKS